MVRKGPVHGPVVVVLDPEGNAKHDELPATWRALTEDVRVVWWRLPAALRAGLTDATLPPELADGRPVHLVASGSAALLAISLATEQPDRVRSIVLAGPPLGNGGASLAGDTIGSACVYHVVTAESDVEADRLPLGHPDVVAAVVRALLAADLQLGTDENSQDNAAPGAGSLAVDAWQALRARLGQLLSGGH